MLIVLVCSQHTYSQNWSNTTNFWVIENNQEKDSDKLISSQKEQIKSIAQLDINKLKKALINVSMFDRTTGFTGLHKDKHTILQMPMPDGGFHAFAVAEAPIMHPHLANLFPEIKAYIGFGIEDATLQLRFDITPNGFHGMIMSTNGEIVLIDPIKTELDSNYRIEFKRGDKKKSSWICEAEDILNKEIISTNKINTCIFRTYRLALASTGEYAQFHGGTKNLVLSAMHNTLTRLNGILERDLSIRLELVENNEKLIFLNAYSDPYSNNDGASMLSQNQTTCDEIIGPDNYDIGHVFSTGGGGIAQLESVCINGQKGRGVTGNSNPAGDLFDIDYVAHEIGHQFGARHTHNNNCNRNNPTAVEPGSGSSIMSYAGICAPNVQENSDAYFHGISIAEINGFLESGGGECAIVSVVNTKPIANAGQDYFIPKGTSFRLRGTGDDLESNSQLSYSWEQVDNQVAVMPPDQNNIVGPLVRSLPPTGNPDRFVPNYKSIISSEKNIWEVLPFCDRNINFRFTVRDNAILGGCTASDEMVLNVVGDAGPFKLNEIKTFWAAGSASIIKWDVAGSNNKPINCNYVDLLLSTDGGASFPYLLASNIPNTGERMVVIPNVNSNRCRVQIKSVGNIFFDISDSDFTIINSERYSVDLEIDHLKCNNDHSGNINAKINGFYDPDFKWSNGSTGNSIFNLDAGQYTVTVSDDEKSFIAEGWVENPPDIKLEVKIENPKERDASLLVAKSEGGTGEHSYVWDNGIKEQFVELQKSGIYSVTVSDENGCHKKLQRFIDLENVDLENNLLENNFKNPIIYPNPSKAEIELIFNQNINGGPELIILNLEGEEVYSEILLYRDKGLRHKKLDISMFAAGMYYLKILESEKIKTVKFIKI